MGTFRIWGQNRQYDYEMADALRVSAFSLCTEEFKNHFGERWTLCLVPESKITNQKGGKSYIC